MKILKIAFLLTIVQVSNFVSAEEIDFESRQYKVVHASGSFGTFGHIEQGDLLIFNPRKLMTSKPGFIDFEKCEVTKIETEHIRAYLDLTEGNFELVTTNINKHAKFRSYSFVSKNDSHKTRFDVIFDDSMIITYEVKGIIFGVVVLDRVKEESELGIKQPATTPDSKSENSHKP